MWFEWTRTWTWTRTRQLYNIHLKQTTTLNYALVNFRQRISIIIERKREKSRHLIGKVPQIFAVAIVSYFCLLSVFLFNRQLILFFTKLMIIIITILISNEWNQCVFQDLINILHYTIQYKSCALYTHQQHIRSHLYDVQTKSSASMKIEPEEWSLCDVCSVACAPTRKNGKNCLYE